MLSVIVLQRTLKSFQDNVNSSPWQAFANSSPPTHLANARLNQFTLPGPGVIPHCSLAHQTAGTALPESFD